MTSETSRVEQLAVIGAGAWGTALASVAARAGRKVALWAREPEVTQSINADRVNSLFLPDVELPDGITAGSDLSIAKGAEAVLMVVPAQFARQVFSQLNPYISPATPVILCSKGIEQDTQKLMTVVLEECLPRAIPAVLSGPSFAKDVALQLPTAVTLACADDPIAGTLADALRSPTFRIYLSDDLIGAEIGGAVKNVLAIACGIVDGRKLGNSARAALIARGFNELQRLAVAMGGKPETLSGLCGLGDVILTCTSRQSRNMSLGVALGEGQSLDDILQGRKSVAEGVATARALAGLARSVHIEMPICNAVNEILHDGLSVDAAIEGLLSRPMGDEH
jgi:glycerol-3-phosphate dehydrogenase (NAD(P)+)